MTIKLKCLSHTPLRGLNDPGADVVAEVDAALAKARAEVEAFDPELIVIFAPDHYNGLFYDLMPPFVIATAAESVADYQTLPGPLSIPRELALDMARFILDSDVDIALSHRLQVDHGCTQTLEELTGSLTRYPVIPIIINSVAPPFGPYRRIRKLGEAVGRFVATLNKRVLILGTDRRVPDCRAQSDPRGARRPPGAHHRRRPDLRHCGLPADTAQRRLGPGLHRPAGAGPSRRSRRLQDRGNFQGRRPLDPRGPYLGRRLRGAGGHRRLPRPAGLLPADQRMDRRLWRGERRATLSLFRATAPQQQCECVTRGEQQ